jgi:hypothetical protein
MVLVLKLANVPATRVIEPQRFGGLILSLKPLFNQRKTGLDWVGFWLLIFGSL